MANYSIYWCLCRVDAWVFIWIFIGRIHNHQELRPVSCGCMRHSWCFMCIFVWNQGYALVMFCGNRYRVIVWWVICWDVRHEVLVHVSLWYILHCLMCHVRRCVRWGCMLVHAPWFCGSCGMYEILTILMEEIYYKRVRYGTREAQLVPRAKLDGK